jgi:uncharacterized protein YajQ (UPF0234 family)
MPSFDIVSKLNQQEVDNAVNQSQKEIATRYDFKDTATEVLRQDMVISLRSSTEDRLRAALDVLQTKLVRRGVSLKSVELGTVEPTAKGHAKQDIKLLEGVSQDRAKEIVRAIKDQKLKVQASIQGDAVRVSGKDKDELQRTIAFVRGQNFPVELQFVNFRD